MLTVLEAAELLRRFDHVLILTHVRPDGDTVGCAAALCSALRALGKTAYLLPNPGLTDNTAPYFAPYAAPEGFVPERVVSVDIAARGLFPDNAREYLSRVDLAIDHHPSQEFFAARTCLDAGRAACGELMYDILRLLGPITADIATPLYVAVSTDCGCFVYGNTTAATHRVAAHLIDCGIPLAQLNKRHFRTKSIRRLRLESAIIAGMQLYDQGTIAVAALTLDMMAAVGADERDAEDIAALVGQLEGVRTSVTIRELAPGRCKISLRTDPDDLNASTVCALMGGGGHAAASGATLDLPVEETRAAVLDAIHQVKGSALT